MCLIGQQRLYTPQEEAAVDLLRQQFLDERCRQTQGCDSEGVEPDSKGVGPGETWASGFSPRDSKEPVKNCSQIDRGLSQFIAERMASELLKTECFISTPVGDAATPSQPKMWNKGGETCCYSCVKSLLLPPLSI